MKLNSNCLYVLAAIPFAGYCGVLLFAVVAYFYLGHWPAYGNPDPKTLGFDQAQRVLEYLLMLALIALPIAVLLGRGLLVFCKRAENPQGFRTAATSLLAPVVVVLLVVVDIAWGGTLNWFLD